MRRYRIRWVHLAVAALLATTTFGMLRMLRAGPQTAPGPADLEAARRVVPPPPGTADEIEPPPPVRTISTGLGIVEPRDRETRVAAPSPGRIKRILVVENQRVAAGDPLVELDDDVEQAALAAAVADADAARAQLARALRGSRGEDIQAAVADGDAADARAALSAGAAERVQQVEATGGATLDELDRARRQAQADAATARAAASRRAAVVTGSRAEDVQLARAQLRAAEARRDQARAALARLTVRAPIAGEILQSKYRAGEYYQPSGESLIALGDTLELTVRMDVDERDLGKVAIGAKVVVRADAYPGTEFTGRVRQLGRRMGRKNVRSDDPAQRNDTKILEAVLTLDPSPGLVPGQRVTCYVLRP